MASKSRSTTKRKSVEEDIPVADSGSASSAAMEMDDEIAAIIDPPNPTRDAFALQNKTVATIANKRREVAMPEKPNQDADFEYVRENLRSLAEEGYSALQDLIQLSKGSDSARSFEAISILINTLSAVNKDMIDLHVKKADIAKKTASTDAESPQTQNNTQNNFIFTGTTEQLQELLKKSNLQAIEGSVEQ